MMTTSTCGDAAKEAPLALLSDTSEAASVKTINDEQKAVDEVKSAITLNNKWKDLDAIFQAQLKKFVTNHDRPKFDALAIKLSFDSASDRDDLFECIKTFIESLQFPPPPPSVPTPHSFSQMNHSNGGLALSATSSRMDHKEPSPLSTSFKYAIPNNSNNRIVSLKRKREEDVDDEDSIKDDFTASEDEDVAPKRKRKKRKTSHTTNTNNAPTTTTTVNDEDKDDDEDDLDQLWKTNTVLSKKDQEELATRSVYVVEKILDHTKNSKKCKDFRYKIKWEGYDDTTYEPPSNLNIHTMLDYWENDGGRKDPEGAMAFFKQQDRERKKRIKKDKTKKKGKKKKSNSSVKKQKKSKKKKSSKQDDSHNDDDDEGAEVFKCTICDRGFKSIRSKNGHMSVHYKGKNKKKEPEIVDIADDTDDDDDDQPQESIDIAAAENQPYWEDDEDTEEDELICADE